MVVDCPLIVEGDLIIEGGFILQNEGIPMIVLGAVYADYLLYSLNMDGHGPHLWVKNKVVLSECTFIEGRAETFDQKNI